MPLTNVLNINADTQIYLWEITEQEKYFFLKLNLSDEDRAAIKPLIPKRRKEWLMPRYICRMLGLAGEITYQKDEYNKPFLKGSDYHISISHSNDLFAFMISKEVCGVDIQYYTAKTDIIKSKFVNENELLALETKKDKFTWLHYIWSAKEAVYKAYGKKQLSFREDIYISLEPNPSIFKTIYNGTIINHLNIFKYDLGKYTLTDFILVYAIEID